jgi:hypothetical protein
MSPIDLDAVYAALGIDRKVEDPKGERYQVSWDATRIDVVAKLWSPVELKALETLKAQWAAEGKTPEEIAALARQQSSHWWTKDGARVKAAPLSRDELALTLYFNLLFKEDLPKE